MGERAIVLGIGIDKVTMSEAVSQIECYIREEHPRFIATANAEMVMLAQKDPELAAILAAADMVVPDGAGVVWAARHKGSPVPERVAGFDLTQRLLNLAAQKEYRVFLFGGAPGIAEAAAANAKSRYQGVNIVGVRNGFFRQEEEHEIVGLIRESKPHILLVALGVPKQEKWLYAHVAELSVPVCIGVGGTFDVMAGIARRAPEWMQRAGIEWLYRLVRQPQRIIRMMALPNFVCKVLLGKND